MAQSKTSDSMRLWLRSESLELLLTETLPMNRETPAQNYDPKQHNWTCRILKPRYLYQVCELKTME